MIAAIPFRQVIPVNEAWVRTTVWGRTLVSLTQFINVLIRLSIQSYISSRDLPGAGWWDFAKLGVKVDGTLARSPSWPHAQPATSPSGGLPRSASGQVPAAAPEPPDHGMNGDSGSLVGSLVGVGESGSLVGAGSAVSSASRRAEKQAAAQRIVAWPKLDPHSSPQPRLIGTLEF